MHRLIEKGLMFGNLIRIDSPVLIERYNRALTALAGRTTDLSEFHIDISGFSPEIAEEFNDPLYLNQAGVNRQFILLSTDQKTAPLLDAKFSTSRGILRQFIDANLEQLFALTARDAVAGEMINSVYRADTPQDLFNIRRISIEADTTQGTVKTAAKLGKMIDTFKSKPDAWWDDVLIAQMIGLAKETGDVTRNPVTLTQADFDADDFWTAHFGGGYLFRSYGDPVVVAHKPWDVNAKQLTFQDRGGIAKFLRQNRLAEPLADARGVDASAILHQKMDFIVADVAARRGEKLVGATRRDMRILGRKYADDLPREWHGLAALARWAEGAGEWPRIDSDHPAYFYSLRATRSKSTDLVNMLLAELSPLDVRQLFICHKDAFYDAYRGWDDAKRDYVADFLSREYAADKAGTRARLFGDHTMPVVSKRPDGDIVDQVGPWGAVRRGR